MKFFLEACAFAAVCIVTYVVACSCANRQPPSNPETFVTDEENTCALLMYLHLPDADHRVVAKVCSVADPAAIALVASYEAAKAADEDGGYRSAVRPAESAVQAAKRVVDALRRDAGP